MAGKAVLEFERRVHADELGVLAVALAAGGHLGRILSLAGSGPHGCEGSADRHGGGKQIFPTHG